MPILRDSFPRVWKFITGKSTRPWYVGPQFKACKTVMYFQTLGNVSKTVTRAAASSGRREAGVTFMEREREGGGGE